MVELDRPNGIVPNPTRTTFRPLPRATEHGYPTSIVFQENPGGEYRKSYHGYPGGYAQLVYAPTTWMCVELRVGGEGRECAGQVGGRAACVCVRVYACVCVRACGCVRFLSFPLSLPSLSWCARSH